VSPLVGKVAVVTGASRGIGFAVASALEGAGARVARVARTLTRARSSTRLDVPCDVTDEAQVHALFDTVRAAFGIPDLVVNAAGAFLLKPFEDTNSADLAAQLAANLQGPFLVARAFLPAMRARGSGRLITIGSIADYQALPGNAAYAASKFGLRGLHEVLRQEYRGSGVLCTLLSPGPTDTAVWDAVNPDARPGFTPRSEMLRPEDVAQTVLWIASAHARVDINWMRLGPAER
jgi:NAD(P)-dependent dehydrogenase (short-subunit alcohol dehydrogenase family)